MAGKKNNNGAQDPLWKVVVDSHAAEGRFVDMLRARGMHVEVSASKLVDFAFVRAGRQEVAIERKSAPDMAASIKDGRIKQQVARMTESGVPLGFVLVVGDVDPARRVNPAERQRMERAIESASVHIMMSSGVKVKWLSSDDDMCDYLKLMHSYLESDPAEVRVSAPYLEEVNLKSAKKKMASGKDMYAAMLSSVCGMTRAKAESVMAAHPNLPALMGYLQRAGSKALADIKTSNGKRLGPALSARIHCCVTGEDGKAEAPAAEVAKDAATGRQARDTPRPTKRRNDATPSPRRAPREAASKPETSKKRRDRSQDDALDPEEGGPMVITLASRWPDSQRSPDQEEEVYVDF